MSVTDKHLLVYISSLPESAEARFEAEKQAALRGALTTGLVWPDSQSEYDWALVRRQIEKADVFMFLLGRQYGPVTPTGISIQHRELVHAQALNKPVCAMIQNAAGTGGPQDQLKLEDLRKQLMGSVPFKVWHLGDELSVHLGSTLQTWQRKGVARWAAGGAPEAVIDNPILSERFRAPAPTFRPRKDEPIKHELVLMVQANVYRGGNLSRHVVKITMQSQRLWRDLQPLLRLGASEDRLRALVEHSVTDEASKRLLAEHPGSHAVDDVRIERNQFRQLLSRWSKEGFVTSQRDGAHVRWSIAGT